MAGPFYAVFWGLIALFGASLVGLFGALPPALLATVAGTALLGSTAGALGIALAGDQDRLAAAGTLAVTDLGRHPDGRRLGFLGARLRPDDPRDRSLYKAEALGKRAA